MINHTDKEDSTVPRSRPQSNVVDKSPPRLVEISSNPGTPLKVTEIKPSDAAGITSLIMAPNANLNSTPVGSSNSVTATTASLGVTTNSVTSNVTTSTSINQDKKDLVNNSHVADGATTDSTKLSNSSAVNNSAEARHYSPSTSPPKSNNLVAVNT